MIDVGEAVGYLDLDTSKFQRGFKSALEDLKVFEDKSATTSQKIVKLGSAVSTVGSTISKTLTVPILGLGAGAITAGIQFESAFAGVRKTVDATEEQFQELEDGIIEMSNRMPQSASEISAVAEAAGQLGIHTESILGFTETMVMLGDATNMSSDEAATALARLANITGMSQDNFDRLGSTIVALGNNLATTESEIVDMAQNLAAAGSQVGLTEAEILAVAGALSSLGVEAAMGGTAFSKILRDMQMSVETGGSALKNFATVANMTSEDFVKAFKTDSAGAIKAFLAGLGDTERLGSSTIKILKDLGIEETRMNDVLSRLANASDLVNNSFEIANGAWKENTALTKEAAQRYETTASQLKMLLNQVQNIGIQFSKALLPVFKSLVSKLQDVTNWFSQLSEEQVKTVVKIGLLVASIGPLLTIIGKAITLIGSLKAVIVALSGPVGIAVAAIAGLTAVIIALATGTDNQTKRQKELNDMLIASKNAYDTAMKSANEQTESLMANSISAKALIDDMYDLSEQEMDTANKIQILKNMNEKLQEILPGVSLEIDAETGKIKTQKEEVNNLIAAQIKLQATKIYGEKNAAEAKRYTEAIIANNKAVENAKATYKDYVKQKEKIAEMEKKEFAWYETHESTNWSIAIAQNKVELNNLAEEYNNYKKIQEDNNKILEESKANMKALQEEQVKVENQIMESLGIQLDANDKIVESNEKVEESNEQITESNENKVNQTKILTGEEQKVIEEAEKAKEKSFKAEKDRYDDLMEATEKYYSDIEKLEKDAQTKREKIYEDEAKQIQEVTEEYNKALESRKQSIRSAYGLFDEFAKKDEDSPSGNQLLKNLKSQLKGIQNWKEDLDKLAERGIAQGLLEELQELGPSAAIEIENLTKLSDKKLQEYVETWEKLNAEIAGQAEKELEPEKLATDAEVDQIRLDTLAKIEEVNSELQNEIKSISNGFLTSLSELGVTVTPEAENVGISIVKAIEIGVEETEESLLTKLNTLKEDVEEIVRSILRSVDRAESAAESIGASDGSHANGLDYVPYDGYRATLHKGERVLTAQEAKEMNRGYTSSGKSQTLNVKFTGTMAQLVRALKPEFELEDSRGGEVY